MAADDETSDTPQSNFSFKYAATFAGLALSLVVAVIVHLLDVGRDATITAAITTLCAVWWVTEAIPIPATSLIPLAFFGLTGVLTAEQIASAYGSPIVLFFLGGFMLSCAMAKSGAHRRLALGIVSFIGGGGPRRLVFGFMAASALLSMFMSNTAALLMLLPIIIATVEGTGDKEIRTVVLLGVAYAASVGGIGTPIGTPPNLLFMQTYSEVTGESISFLRWMMMALPIVIVMLPITGLWLTRNLGQTYEIDLPPVGKWQACEVRTLTVFVITALLWITRVEPFGGWSGLLNLPGANDASVALIAVVVMFLLPDGRGGRLMDWETANKIPWGMILLFAGGIVIARAFTASGLGSVIGGGIVSFGVLPFVVMLLAVCIAVTFLTELTSNTATAALLMPVLASAALAADLDPRQLMLPAVISTSFAFMLPVATPTNAVVYATGFIDIRRMAREGFLLNVLGVGVISVMLFLQLR